MDKQNIILEYGKDDKNTGSTEVQVALLTGKIGYLTEHLKEHKKDFASRLGLMKSVGRRKRLLTYLKNKNFARYKDLIDKLGIRK